MEPEKSLLEQISEKEGELKRKNDQVCKEAEDIISQARKHASVMLDNAERDGKIEADRLLREELDVLSRDIDSIRAMGRLEAEQTRLLGEQNLSRAVQIIIRAVTG
ncbi:MAG TPA: V-type ATPase subunit subunit G family protein [Methanospirillum sp.]|nr:V-type ATPase subunit subunit G family protein [Methanospirillum sp.]